MYAGMKWRKPSGLRKESAAYSLSTSSSGISRQCSTGYRRTMSLSSMHRSCSSASLRGRGASPNASSTCASALCTRQLALYDVADQLRHGGFAAHAHVAVLVRVDPMLQPALRGQLVEVRA